MSLHMLRSTWGRSRRLRGVHVFSASWDSSLEVDGPSAFWKLVHLPSDLLKDFECLNYAEGARPAAPSHLAA